MNAFVGGPAPLVTLSPGRSIVNVRQSVAPSRRFAPSNRRLWSMSRAGPGEGSSGAGNENSGVNVSKYSSQRSIISADKDVTPKEINDLLVKAGKAPRDAEKWKRAVEHSYVVVTAKLLTTGTLVGFARATSDRALNGTIWDLITDPSLPDQGTMARNIITYLLREIRRTVPTCSVALCAEPDQIKFFEGMDFVAEPDGIAMMQITDDYQIKSKLPER